MITKALWVRLEAKPGKEQEVAQFLKGGLALVRQEPGTVAWFGLQLSASVFGIFDAFENDGGRDAHLNGKVAEA
jgi:quinol monooxygenase YgiN